MFRVNALRSKEPHPHAQSWQVVIADGDTQESISIQTPFVLVGKHKACQVQIEKDGVPNFAYLVVSARNKIEAWPLAVGLEFLSSASEKLSISLESVAISFAAENSLGPPQVYDLPKVLLTARSEETKATMKKSILVASDKRVLIIGRRRPSNCRIRGAQLETCDIALVYDRSRIWIVDLVAERSFPKLSKRIDLLPLAPRKVDIGGLSVSASLPSPATGPAETLAQTVRRNPTDEIDLAARLSKLGKNQPLSWRSIGLIGLSLLALFATVFALYHVVAGLVGQR